MELIICVLSAVFVAVTGGSDASMQTGYFHTCAIHNQAVKCWGWNDRGQLGLGHTNDLYEPQEDPIDFGADFVPVDVKCGYYHNCAVSTTGGLKCWGYNHKAQLGYGDDKTRGAEPDEMGDNLALVELPSGFELKDIELAATFACVLSMEMEVFCWGANSVGQLGLGHANNTGDEPGEMGDNMMATDIGSNFQVQSLHAQVSGMCALSNDGHVKCWGHGSHGRLGYGDDNHRGDNDNEMGDFLPELDLGTGFIVETLRCSWASCCVLSRTTGALKCWGINNAGQLGYGDTIYRGGHDNEMGDYLPVVDVGTGFEIEYIECPIEWCCVISTEGELKCWGNGYSGQLGYGNRQVYRGDQDNEMGDYLPVVDVGTGFTASGMRLADGWSMATTCSFEEGTDELLAKCWGYSNHGQTGYGSTLDRYSPGDTFIDFGTWPDSVPTVYPSAATTAAPTTATPSSVPTTSPSVSPTEPICEAADMTTVNWHDMFHGDGAEDDLLKSHSVEFDSTTFSLTMSATVEYVGLSGDGNLDEEYNLGTTYWIDFQSFAEISDSVADAGSCGNRRAADYSGLSFDEWWSYTVDPRDLEGAATAERMAYPPSNWSLSPLECNTVTYERTFTLAELTDCAGSDGSPLVTAVETDDAISYEGTLFVELLSPYSMAESDYFRTFSLLQYEFAVQLIRSANALSSTGTLLFKVAATGIAHSVSGDYEMRILTQSADFISLGDAVVVSNPMDISGITVEQETSGCLVYSSNVCAQIFVVTIPSDINCSATSSGDEVVDLSGLFQIAFSPQCRDENAMCTEFVEGLGDSGAVVLDLDWTFVDRTCGVNLFDAPFAVNLTFFKDDQFSVAVDGVAFVVDQDTIYGEVEVTWPSEDEMYDVLAVSIENVFVCTSDNDTDLSSTLNVTEGSGGCLSSEVDSDGLYTVIGSGADAQYGGDTEYEAPSANRAHFSFMAFETGRTSINVHVEVVLTLQTENGRRRQRMLLEDIGANQIRHSMQSAIVTQPEEEFGVEVVRMAQSGEGFGIEVVMGTAIGSAAIVGMAVFVVMVLMKRSKKRESGKGTDSGVGPAVHVPDLSPSKMVPPTTGPVTIVFEDGAAEEH